MGVIGRPAPCCSPLVYPKAKTSARVSVSLSIEFLKRRRKQIGMVKALEQPGGKMVVELVGAFNELTERMSVLSSSSSRLLFKTLKLSLPILHSLPLLPDGRDPLSRALSLALFLAHLQMDAEAICAGILRQVIEGGMISMNEVRERIGMGTAHLLHESMRLNNISSKVEALDDESAFALRKFCLTYYDVRAIILDLVLKLDMMRHLDHLPRYKQQMVSVQVMKIYAPLAHAVGITSLSMELEDLSFRYMFPYSYLYVDTWLRSHETVSKPLLDMYEDQLLNSLTSDQCLTEMVQHVSVEGRFKSRYSTMKKLLRDGRKPEQVNDILGLRVVITPLSGVNSSEIGEKACYRARDIIQSLWKEIPSRFKDYITRPKFNGYKSLHMAVDISDNGRNRPLMEIQIRTAEMDMLAAGGTASHALYKGGLTNPEEAKRLKAIMMAAAELAALRLRDLPSSTPKGLDDSRNRVFHLLDKNGDGKISVEELMEVMEELGAEGEDAREMMQLLDSNSDGLLSSDEFDLFQKQVKLIRNLEYRDGQYKIELDEIEKLLQIEDTTQPTLG
ncbi:probable GTP diphosphokinase CRSH, chloroplastic [Salvia miltiorrhiza]|uniref:probable GTP diphosphokinase CRSH, chloroplastic n=1 Tax=Salvia miltiorrhiza TaxID=226208 RepID=UPI0025ABE3C1|nr:probable GTP diphosphokinase CRSH, chloroplastic [Salvia miltiorrhiza]XP_057806877.1 probable GTP diphosphokinase CRSH, chloroplastic [Salvia miltiorrhiza]